jgi:quercetin dioxygenase-like cupin family protein
MKMNFKVDFDQLEWQAPLAGARFKAHREHGRQIRLVEFTSDFVEPVWCEKGHVGLVLEGELEVDFRGERQRYRPGEGIFIPAGAHSAHKARSLTPVVRLVLVEDI